MNPEIRTKASMITVLMLLSACSSSSGGGSAPPVTSLSDAHVAAISRSVDNKAEVVDFVETKLGEELSDGTVARIMAASDTREETEKKYVVAAEVLSFLSYLGESEANLQAAAASDPKFLQKLQYALALVDDANKDETDLSTLITYIAGANLSAAVSAVQAKTAINTQMLDDIALNAVAINGFNKVKYNLNAGKKIESIDYEIWVGQGMTEYTANGCTSEPCYVGTVTFSADDFKDGGASKKTMDNVKELGYVVAGKVEAIGSLQEIRDAMNDQSIQANDPNLKKMVQNETTQLLLAGQAMGLSFTDFGYFQTRYVVKGEDGTGYVDRTERTGFVGGYDSKEIAKANIASTMNFEGKAYGGVMRFDTDEALALEGKATLNFNPNGGNPMETLNARFSDSGWYDVTVKDGGGFHKEISFTNEAAVANDAFKWGAGKLGTAPNTADTVDIKYYGDISTQPPTEVSGSVGASSAGGSSFMGFVFGGKKK